MIEKRVEKVKNEAITTLEAPPSIYVLDTKAIVETLPPSTTKENVEEDTMMRQDEVRKLLEENVEESVNETPYITIDDDTMDIDCWKLTI